MNQAEGSLLRSRGRTLSACFGLLCVAALGCATVQKPILGEPQPAIPAVIPPPAAATSTPSAESPHVDTSVVRASVSSAPIEPPSIPPPVNVMPIDLPTALRLAEAENPHIGEARAHVAESFARYHQACLELIPSLNGGVNYDGHTGPLQRSSGEILQVSRQAVYVGGGVQAEAAGPPAVPAVFLLNQLANGLYDPLAARQRLDQVEFNAQATANEVLGEVAEYYLELQGALALLEARRRNEADAAEVFRVARQYALVGQGSEADSHRAETELNLRQGQLRQAEEAVAVASARLSRRLHLDPSIGLQPVGDPLLLYPLIDLETPVEDLIARAVELRPEVNARSAGMAEAETRARQEVARPLLPTIFLGFSGAAFGGGSNREPPLVGTFRGRTDFDVAAYWSLMNFGLGNAAQIRRREIQVGEALSERSQAVNLVRDEVASARADALAQSERIEIARQEMLDALDGFSKDLERLKNAVGDIRPIELTNSMNLLKKAREQYIETIIGYNQAQFRLFVALGSPPPLDAPTAPAPVSLADLGTLPTDRDLELEVAASDDPSDAHVQPALTSPDRSGAVAAIDTAHARAVETARQYQQARDRFQAAVDHGEDVESAAHALDEAHRASVAAESAFVRALDAARQTKPVEIQQVSDQGAPLRPPGEGEPSP